MARDYPPPDLLISPCWKVSAHTLKNQSCQGRASAVALEWISRWLRSCQLEIWCLGFHRCCAPVQPSPHAAASGELKAKSDSEFFGSALPCFGGAQTDIKTLESLLLFLAEAISFPVACSWSELG